MHFKKCWNFLGNSSNKNIDSCFKLSNSRHHKLYDSVLKMKKSVKISESSHSLFAREDNICKVTGQVCGQGHCQHQGLPLRAGGVRRKYGKENLKALASD